MAAGLFAFGKFGSQAGLDLVRILSHSCQPILDGLKVLEAAEKTYAGSPDAIGEFKFASNSDMLAHIERGS